MVGAYTTLRLAREHMQLNYAEDAFFHACEWVDRVQETHDAFDRIMRILTLLATAVVASTAFAGSASAAAVSIDLCATTGSTVLPGPPAAVAITVWGFAPGDCFTTGNAAAPGPVLVVAGSKDGSALEDSSAFAKAADAAGAAAEVYIYPGAVHAFAQPLFNQGKTYDAVATETAWRLTEDFLKRRRLAFDPSERIDSRDHKRSQIGTGEAVLLQALHDIGDFLFQIENRLRPLFVFADRFLQRLIRKFLQAPQHGMVSAAGKRRLLLVT